MIGLRGKENLRDFVEGATVNTRNALVCIASALNAWATAVQTAAVNKPALNNVKTKPPNP